MDSTRRNETIAVRFGIRGVGVVNDLAAHIFEAFLRRETRCTAPPNGLSLALVHRRIIQRRSGSVRNGVGVGSNI